MLVYYEKVPRHFWRIAIKIVKQKGTTVRIEEANAILKRPVNKLFLVEYTYHDTNQTDKAREQKLR